MRKPRPIGWRPSTPFTRSPRYLGPLPGNRPPIFGRKSESGSGPACGWPGPHAGSPKSIEGMPADGRPQRRSQPQALGRLRAIRPGNRALRDYDSAPTVARRQVALEKIHESLTTLSSGNRQHPWWPSSELEAAVNDLFNRPNVDIAADVNTVAPLPGRNPGADRSGSAERVSLAGHRRAQDRLRI